MVCKIISEAERNFLAATEKKKKKKKRNREYGGLFELFLVI